MNPLGPLRYLKKRLAREASELGLKQEVFVLIPADEHPKDENDADGVDVIQAVFLLTEEAVEDEDQAAVNRQFREMVEAERQQTDEERTKQQEASARDMLKEWDF